MNTPVKRPTTNWSSLVADKSSELTTLKTTVSTLKTQIENSTFSSYEIEHKYHELKRIVRELANQIEELRGYERASLDEINQRFSIEYSKMILDHESRVNAKKEEISDEVEKLIESRTRLYEREISDRESTIKSMRQEIANVDKMFVKKLEQAKQQVKEKEQQLSKEIQESIFRNNEEKEEIYKEVLLMEQEISDNQTAIQDLEAQQTRYTSILEQLKAKHKSKQPELTEITNKINTHKSTIANLASKSQKRSDSTKQIQSELIHINQNLLDHEQIRRKLHAKLQDLKGNIRVFCRIRPLLPGQSPASITVPDDELDEDAKQEIIVARQSSDKLKFSFDKVFPTTSDNTVIFEEISQLIQCSLDGSKVCVFAYGQTGSGKTYTMSHTNDGMIPLSITKIFNDIEELKTHGWEYTIHGQFLEIYNDTIIDLLGSDEGKHEIKHDDTNQTTKVTNATTVQISSKHQAIDLLNHANTHRSTASTKANERSSRSHSIFILSITGHNTRTNSRTSGTLNLIDLAGSERLAVSKAEGDRLRETQAINKSLSNLGDVIHALRQGDAHVPYRNSKLTYLLKHSLGNKTLMFVCVGSGIHEVNETVNSLRFASKVNSTRAVTPTER
ncbi:uncharacterized protein SPAPADRAFT_136354 [Spathaspora passalidarum NRRL Y-27907]|uniref:Kinesin-like protein n=1 Tax=Spathaspora passalidarum (strain NRRL Y-27907 / 11-Y1) TaxID=619300 RepID=G3AM72_SPAPN|nr:uncharacterized protein SPAPADRAFT_136354 [Spathaspora passalidarum NRRL Y-27907]EGW32777.1 hypothetical protein SPAPADRAFT_136354 [Spathaspora passalidarum NRRL Y-27907]